MSIDDLRRLTGDVYRQLIITLPEGEDVARLRERLRAALKGVDYHELGSIEEIRAELIELGPGEDMRAISARLLADKVAAAAEQNRVLNVFAAAPVNDPLYPDQWALHHLGAEQAWLRVRSVTPSVVVAVVDTGINTTHPDLVPHLWTDSAGHHGVNFVDGTFDVHDADGHGTQLAGLIGAQSHDGFGIAAAKWPVQLMAVKFIDVDHRPDAWTAALSIVWAAVNGAHVVNASWGVTFPFAVLRNAIAWASGVLVVAAAGNDGLDNDVLPTYPASFPMLPNLMAVMACNRHDDKPWFSNYGLATVHLAAPGLRVLTTDTFFATPRWRPFTGTSAACALVSYAAALIKSLNPTWTPAQIRDHLVQSAEPSRWLKCIARGRLSLDRAVLGPLAITAPGPGTVWRTSKREAVAWTNSYATGVPTTTVSVELSVNGGPYAVVAAGQKNDGACTVRAPGVKVTEARLRIRSDQAPSLYADSAVFAVQ